MRTTSMNTFAALITSWRTSAVRLAFWPRDSKVDSGKRRALLVAPARSQRARPERCRVLSPSALAALHGAFLPQRLQPCPRRQAARGGADAQGHPCSRGLASRPAQRGGGCRATARHEARQGGRAGRDGGARDPVVLRVSRGALAAYPDQQSARAHHARDPQANPRGRRLPRRQLGPHLAAARLRHIAGTRWSTKRYLNMELLRQRNAMFA